jgi:hypothetical protein
MKHYYQQSIKVYEKPRAFSRIDIGNTFTISNQIVGFGSIFVGFPTYIKINETDAINIENGRTKVFKGEEEMLLIKYGSIENRK